MQTTPRFKHDCLIPGCCLFRGRTLRSDVYTTNHQGESGRIGLLMRQGDDGPDYRSWPEFRYARLSAQDDAEVFHALQLAESALAG